MIFFGTFVGEMCVDIGYKSALGADGLPKYIAGIKIDRSLQETDLSIPHIQAHTSPSCVVVASNQTGPYATKMTWGFVADFMVNNPALHRKYANQLFNARSEKICMRESLWNPYLSNRCLLVTAGVYEHQSVSFTTKKIPHYITLSSGDPLLIPAIYNPSTNSFALITRQANALFKEIHNAGPNKHRMPLLLPPTLAGGWIAKKISEKIIEEFFNYELNSSLLRHHTVYSLRSSEPRPDGKQTNDFFCWRGPENENNQLCLF